MDAYCVKCKQKREMKDPQAAFAVNGTPITQGTCNECGTKLVKFGATEAHAHMEKPVHQKVSRTSSASSSKAKRSNADAQSKSSAATRTKTTSAKKPAVRKSTARKSNVSSASAKGLNLVIVESPTKAKTVGRFLGKGYVVRASVGHVRDLKKSTLSVDLENDFEPEYRVPNEKRAVVKELTALSKDAKQIYLATDPDREGEAIAWHLMETAEMDPSRVERVVFHEITQNAIEEAFRNPIGLNMDLVNAQQARRILDRLVGFNISPLLWKKVGRNLSGGRVQSVALRLIVDREREIEAFDPVEYWTITAELQPEGINGSFLAKLVKINDEDPGLATETEVNKHVALLKKALYKIESIKKGTRSRKPYPPFTTSTLQQEASRKIGFSASRTMRVAQQLYEGIDVGTGGATGLITYMRTDSTNIAEQAQAEARAYIVGKFGAEYAPDKAPVYKTRSKGAQEAHEAVRPTSVMRTPEEMKNYLSAEQLKLYRLIWQRFVASQMKNAEYDTMTIDIDAKNRNAYRFRSSGSSVRFPGFLALYEESVDEDVQSEVTENVKFPKGICEGQNAECKRILPEQHFTQPPARYTEATLVRTMEENGIGRPSTYASILSTIQARNYVYIEKKRLYPTETGMIVTDLLVEFFPSILNIGFTSEMEQELDEIAEGDMKWRKVTRSFWEKFEPLLQKAQANMPVRRPEPIKVGRECPECGKELVQRNGKFGPFISCSGFPACHYTERIIEKVGVSCPKCAGDLIVKRSRNGKVFYGCLNYPDCDFVQWKKPVPQKCPDCGGMMVLDGKNKLRCINCNKIVRTEEREESESA